MRLILKEYVSSLREKDELDLLLSDIYAEKGYITDTLPKTGNRQYGVDIQMHNDNEVLMFVVKQGNIDRNKWNGDNNSVRQSLEEIKDVSVNMLFPEDRHKELKILVATNGILDETIKMNWSGYVSSNIKWGDIDVNIQFLGIDGIVRDIQEVFFNEYIFSPYLKSSLRKALYFIDADIDYNPQYYERILDHIMIESFYKAQTQSQRNKAWAVYYMISQMIAKYAHDAELNKIAIMVTEYAIIRYWSYLFKYNCFEKEKDIEQLLKLLKRYLYWNQFYLSEVEQIVSDKADLPIYSIVEAKVILYDILGFLSSYASILLNIGGGLAKHVIEIIIQLLNKYEYYKLPPYDVSIAVIIMIIDLLSRTNQIDNVKNLMENILIECVDSYRRLNIYPAPTDSFEEACRIHKREKGLEYQVSSFWGYFMLLIYKIDDKELYDIVKEFVKKDLLNTSKCVWFLRKEEEEKYYENTAMYKAGEGLEITVHEDYDEFRKAVAFILEQYKNEEFSFDLYGFSMLENIVCRYYGYIPRVRIT